MPYVLGVHLGATATTAAIARRDGSRWAAAAPVPLAAGPVVPTVLCKVQDGSFVAGEAAQRQEIAHHEWVVRGFTARLGDDLPLLVGSEFVPAQRLVAAMVEWVADVVAGRQGHPAEHIAIAHSATWGPHRIRLVQQALAQLGLNEVTMVPEPLAVALDYAAKQRVAEHEPIAVANIGGSGMDATVLRRRQRGFEVVGSTLAADHPSGQDLDDEIFAAVRAEFGDQLEALDLADLNQRAALAHLRAECVRAKEALSQQSGAQIRVELPGVRTEFALSRSRYEQLARPHLERVPELVLQAVQSATLTPDDLDAVVLAGGTARVPLLKQLVAERLKVPPQVDVSPELAAACGAASAAVQLLSTDSDEGSISETSVLVRIEGSDFDEEESEIPDAPRPPIDVEPLPLEPPDEDRARRIKIIKLSAAAVLVIVGLLLTFLWPDSSKGGGMLGLFQLMSQ
ncbi:Hsp70 protein [Saccharopolyspora antimicrobica]|uniref:Hsp70 protein n=1 Tax=Saccharopolyspora antimicrobica TaxID=455193 RepID=A0A1I5IN89_9PSEU|nr:Hsp70 family protein [Saccharopolyspora antimicrobica]RKT84066.1 Hsp70 protein [Saccharopolyspora antimicrobica]SFO61954.1 Hsp70 protein [Saccharopolyspora antimicrobica]